MNNLQTIKILASMIVIDAVLLKLDSEFRALGAEISEIESGIETSTKRNEAIASELQSLETQKSAVHYEIRSLNQQTNLSKDKLGKARTERETQAVQRELEELRKLLKDKEFEESGLQQRISTLRDESVLVQKKYEDFQLLHGEKNSGLVLEHSKLQAEMAVKQEERTQIQKGLPLPLYRKYEAIRQKLKVGATYTENGTCRACHIALPPQLFHRMQREPLIEQCVKCQRLIFFKYHLTDQEI